MTNFIAFRFTDNDFHVPLRQAITHIVENRSGELTLDQWREFVLRGMVAFNSIRRIDSFVIEHPGQIPNTDYVYYRKYFEKTLQLFEVNNLFELDNFEGYVFDVNTLSVFYQGY